MLLSVITKRTLSTTLHSSLSSSLHASISISYRDTYPSLSTIISIEFWPIPPVKLQESDSKDSFFDNWSFKKNVSIQSCFQRS